MILPPPAKDGAGGGTGDLAPFLRFDAIIDGDHPAVAALARELSGGPPVAVVERCFTWVRDAVAHSVDHQRGPVTCRASDVLAHRTGYCYAKAHLLAALLRANAIPAGLCYQRLAVDAAGPPFCLHGLNAVWLDGIGWYRIDPRGNKPGVDARFTPPIEALAFAPTGPGEADLPGIFAEPLPEVVAALAAASDWRDVLANLPDHSI